MFSSILLAALGTTVITAILVFLLFVMVLVGIILYAKSKLTFSGLVSVTINGQDPIKVEAGNTLLTTLGNQKIFLPSACGGGGTCAMCKCQIFDGGRRNLTN